MLTLTDARAAYAEARATAGAAYDRVIAPAAARLAKATTQARQISEPIPRDALDAWLAASGRAREIYDSIVSGPRDDVDEALRGAGILTDERS